MRKTIHGKQMTARQDFENKLKEFVTGLQEHISTKDG